MYKPITIKLDVVVDKEPYIEDLRKPQVLDKVLDAGYQAMAADKMRKDSAMVLVSAHIKIVVN